MPEPLTPDDDLAWQAEGLCAQTDPEAFFPEKGGSTRDAKTVCNGRPASTQHSARPPCPVKAECLKYALDNDERFGIWGGLSERERRKLKPGPTPTGSYPCRHCGAVLPTTQGRGRHEHYCAKKASAA